METTTRAPAAAGTPVGIQDDSLAGTRRSRDSV